MQLVVFFFEGEPTIISDKEQLCDNDSVISISQLVHNHDIITSEPYTSDEYNVFIPITSAQDELKPRLVAGCKVFKMKSFHI